MNLTNRCPNACDFCLRTHGPGVGDAESLWLDREPTKEEIWEDISKRELKDYPELVFCGYGEPTCRLEDMLWLCGKIREASHISIRVNTKRPFRPNQRQKNRPGVRRPGGYYLHQLKRRHPWKKYQEICPLSVWAGGVFPPFSPLPGRSASMCPRWCFLWWIRICPKGRSRNASAWQSKTALCSGFAPILKIKLMERPGKNFSGVFFSLTYITP